MDRYARSWMSFLQPNVCTSERTPYAPSLMLRVAGRGYVELLRMRIRQTSQNSVLAKFTGIAHLPHWPGPESLPQDQGQNLAGTDVQLRRSPSLGCHYRPLHATLRTCQDLSRK